MSEDIKTVARQCFETVWTQGDLSAVDEIYTQDYVAHIASVPTGIEGVEQFKQFVALFRALSPDLRFEIEDQIAEGDKVATRWTARSRGAADSSPDTTKAGEVVVTGITIHQVTEGRLTESWDNWDALTAFQALGQDAMETLMVNL